jgi:hypothetical protein
MDMEACDLDRSGKLVKLVTRRRSTAAAQKRGMSMDPRAVLTTYSYLTYSTPPPRPQHAIVSAELRCIILQLVSIANSGLTGEEADHAGVAVIVERGARAAGER